VKETIKVAPEQVKSLKGSQAVALRGRLVTLRHLASLLAPPRETGGKRYRIEGREGLVVDDTGNVPIVVVEVGGERFGLVVDAVEGRQDIVLKPLPEYLARLPGLSSATVMGDGAIVLILDPADMLAAALSQVSHEAADAH
jgi:two-component system chemotaxis sensor kinase CheA